jgi:hypothetical protein
MPNFLAQLTREEQAQLREDLNYLNLEEIRSFCSTRGIPYKIVAKYPGGRVKATKDTDRKPVALERIRRYLRSGKAGEPTCLSAEIVRENGPPSQPKPDDRIYYRWYAKEHTGVLQTLRDLTGGQFVDGAVARVLIMDYWKRDQAPTLEEFADAWSVAKTDERMLLTPQYAYLTDLQQKRAGDDWKSIRNAKARSALGTLERICSVWPLGKPAIRSDSVEL